MLVLVRQNDVPLDLQKKFRRMDLSDQLPSLDPFDEISTIPQLRQYFQSGIVYCLTQENFDSLCKDNGLPATYRGVYELTSGEIRCASVHVKNVKTATPVKPKAKPLKTAQDVSWHTKEVDAPPKQKEKEKAPMNLRVENTDLRFYFTFAGGIAVEQDGKVVSLDPATGQLTEVPGEFCFQLPENLVIQLPFPANQIVPGDLIVRDGGVAFVIKTGDEKWEVLDIASGSYGSFQPIKNMLFGAIVTKIHTLFQVGQGGAVQTPFQNPMFLMALMSGEGNDLFSGDLMKTMVLMNAFGGGAPGFAFPFAPQAATPAPAPAPAAPAAPAAAKRAPKRRK